MKNLKKLLAVLVVVTTLVTTIVPAFAAGSYNYSTQAQALYNMGLYKGTSTTSFEPALGSSLTREMGVVMLIRMLGKESAALALTDADVNATLIIFSDASSLSSWAKKFIAYAVLYKLVAGKPNGTFAPQEALTGRDYCTFILRSLGYTIDASNYAGAAYFLNDKGGITFAEASKFNEKELTRDDMVGITFNSLKVQYNTTKKTMMQTMVEGGIVTEQKAIENGAFDTELAAAAEKAVAAYEAAAIATKDQITASATLKATADTAVAKIVVAATKAAFLKRIDAKKAAADTQLAAINNGDATAETAVKAYETASIATTADITAAETLGVTAADKVDAVIIAATKTAFLTRIDAQKAKIAARKVDLANIADATTAANAYVAAPYNTLENIAAAEALEATARTAIAKIVDTTAKADLTKKVDDNSKLVAANKVKLTGAAVAVTADNFKTMKIDFSKVMNSATLTTSTIKLNDGAMAYAITVSSDKKSVILDYTNAIDNQSTPVKVTIDGAKDADGVAMSRFEQTYTVKDITDPSISSVSVISAKTIKINTSEAVSIGVQGNTVVIDGTQTNGAVIKVDNNFAFGTVTTSSVSKYVQIDFQYPLTAGSHSIAISGMKDFAGFQASGTFDIVVADDKVAPVATAFEVLGVNKVKLTFNENIASGTGAYSTGAFAVKQAGDAARIIGTVDPVNIPGTGYKDNTVTFALASNVDLRSTLGIDVYYNNISDCIGNTVATEAKISGVVADDTTKPTLASVSVQSDNTIKVTFSEKVNAAAGNFKLLTKAITATGAAVSSDGLTYTVTFAGLTGTNAFSDTLDIQGVTDFSVRQNVIDAVRSAVAFNDNALPTISLVAYTTSNVVNGVGNYTVDIYFSETMNAADVTSKGNYYFTYTDSTTTVKTMVPLSVINNATVTTADNKKVTVVIPGIKGVSSVSILARDLKLNALQGNGSIGLPYTIDYNTAVALAYTNTAGFNNTTAGSDIKSLKAVEPYKIRLTLNGSPNLFSTTTAVDINSLKLIYTDDLSDTDIAILGAVVSADGKNLDITINKNLQKNATYGVGPYRSIALVSSGLGIKDQYGFSLNLSYTEDTSKKDNVVGDLIAPKQTSVDLSGITATFDAITGLATTAMAGNAVLNFDEAVVSKTGIQSDIAYGLTVVIGGSTLTPGLHYTTTIAPDGKSINVVFTADGLGKAKGALKSDKSNMTVKITNSAYITDAATNAVVVLP